LDLRDPQGVGKRRKRALADTGEAVLVRREGLVRRENDRNFFPIKRESNKSADFGDNVGLTVILPGGFN